MHTHAFQYVRTHTRMLSSTNAPTHACEYVHSIDPNSTNLESNQGLLKYRPEVQGWSYIFFRSVTSE